MIELLTGLFSVFTSGAGGGLLGGIFGLFKQSQERKERVEIERLKIERDKVEYLNADKERAHAITMLEKGAHLEIEKVVAEADAEIEISHQAALSSAQDALKGLNTTTGMDNYRASVRPSLAYWAMGVFSTMLGWAFWEYRELISDDKGLELLVGMFATLTFIATSMTTFYFVSRRNSAPSS